MPDPLHCNFCGRPWDSGLFAPVIVADHPPEANRLLNTICRSCQSHPADDRRDRIAEGLAVHERLCCTFCGGAWGSGLFFRVPTREDPERKVPFPCCLMCNATRTDDELREQFYASAGLG